jgi:SM-20-related protein
MPATEQSATPQGDEQLFKAIASDLHNKGYSINPHALPPQLADGLLQQLLMTPAGQFTPAGIGRAKDRVLDHTVRKDKICWITGDSAACRQWLQWTQRLQQRLNQDLFLGLFSFESHFARYSVGDFYRRHLDSFKGEGNRTLSVVAYLNPDWREENGGKLMLYPNKIDCGGIGVTPAHGTVVVFLSEEFEHEVLPAQRDRFSIAGWFRANSSSALGADPPAWCNSSPKQQE